MSTKNDITGDNIRSKALSQKGRDNWDLIFGNKNSEKEVKEDGVDSKQTSDDAVTED